MDLGLRASGPRGEKPYFTALFKNIYTNAYTYSCVYIYIHIHITYMYICVYSIFCGGDGGGGVLYFYL